MSLILGLSDEIIGSWELESRLDYAADGGLRDEAALGSDPIGMLTYTKTRFAAQFMRRVRTGAEPPGQDGGLNNTVARGGYDAYFGTYDIASDGEVTHRLDAALSLSDVGLEMVRVLTMERGKLVVRMATSTASGEKVTRVLTWRRVT